MPSDSEPKKILIVALPRSGTTVLQTALSKHFKIPNLNEPYNDPRLDPYEWTCAQQQGVIKLLTQNLYDIDVERLILIGQVDHVVLIDRDNLTDCCVSLYNARVTDKYHYNAPTELSPFECPLDWAHSWTKHYVRYQLAKDRVMSMGISYSCVSYDEYMNDKIQNIAGYPLQRSCIEYRVSTISTDFRYDKLCINYQQIKDRIAELLQDPMDLLN